MDYKRVAVILVIILFVGWTYYYNRVMALEDRIHYLETVIRELQIEKY